MYGNQAGGIALFQTDGGGPSINNIVADNTIVSPSNGRFDLNIQDVSGISVYNNIFYNSNAAAGSIEVPSGSLSGFTSNYNVIVNAFSANGGSSNETLSQWQSSTGQDLHSIIATPSQLFVSPATNNYQELSTSPSIGQEQRQTHRARTSLAIRAQGLEATISAPTNSSRPLPSLESPLPQAHRNCGSRPPSPRRSTKPFNPARRPSRSRTPREQPWRVRWHIIARRTQRRSRRVRR